MSFWRSSPPAVKIGPEVLLGEGFRLARQVPELAAAFGMDGRQWEAACNETAIGGFLDRLPERARTRPDYTFSALNSGLASAFGVDAKAIESIRTQLESGGYPVALFSDAASHFRPDARFEDALRHEASATAKLADRELGSAIGEKFDIRYRPLRESPLHSSFAYSKINHGYWEHFLSVRSEAFPERAAAGEYRELDRAGFEHRYALSGFDTALGAVLRRAIADGVAEGPQRLAISFCAGESQHAAMMKRPLVPVSRAAMAGALAFFRATSSAEVIPLGDGAEAKGLLDERQVHQFVDDCAAQSDAILLVVPPHLARLRLAGFSGPTYTLQVPGRFVHESWRTVLPAYLGTIRRLQHRHRRLTVLTQAAVLSPVLGLTMGQVPGMLDAASVVRFFDLGRVLDLGAPEVVQKQGWFRPYCDLPLSELSPFELGPQPTEPALLMIDGKEFRE